MSGYGLSLSRLLAGRQCPKRLWLEYQCRNVLKFPHETCHDLGIGHDSALDHQALKELQRLFPNGILIKDGESLFAVSDAAWKVFTNRPNLVRRLLNRQHLIDSTTQAIAAYPDCPLFDAAFIADGMLVRVDLLLPTPKGYRMVKMTDGAGVKSYHLEISVFLAWALLQNGFVLYSIELAHIDHSRIDRRSDECICCQRLDEWVYPLVEWVPGWISEARWTIVGDEPTMATGAHCDEPFECPFKIYCNRGSAQADGEADQRQ